MNLPISYDAIYGMKARSQGETQLEHMMAGETVNKNISVVTAWAFTVSLGDSAFTAFRSKYVNAVVRSLSLSRVTGCDVMIELRRTKGANGYGEATPHRASLLPTSRAHLSSLRHQSFIRLECS